MCRLCQITKNWIKLGLIEIIQFWLMEGSFFWHFDFLLKPPQPFTRLFFLKNWEDISPFCGTTDAPVLDLWWYLLLVSNPHLAALFTLGRGIHITHTLIFTSGVTPANLLASSMATEPISSSSEQALVGLKNWDLLCCRRTLYRLSYVC